MYTNADSKKELEKQIEDLKSEKQSIKTEQLHVEEENSSLKNDLENLTEAKAEVEVCMCTCICILHRKIWLNTLI